MARLVTAGAEIRDHPTTDVGSPDGFSAGAAATVTDLVNVRSGSASWLCQGTAANSCYRAFPYTSTGALGADFMGRAFLFNMTALPSTTVKVARFVTAAAGNLASVRMTSAGNFQLWNDVAGTQIGSTSTLAAEPGRSYRVQLRVRIGTGAVDQAEMRVMLDDPTATDEIVSGSTLTISDTLPGRFDAGWVDAPGVTASMNVDDVGTNDSTGTNENSWPGPGRVVLSLATWTGWTGGTNTDCSGAAPDTTQGSNMANAMNNVPPRGQADHTTAGHASDPDQVRTTGTLSPLKIWCQPYSTLGAIGDIQAPFQLLNVLLGSGSTANAAYGDQIAQSFFINGTLQSFTIGANRVGTPTDDLTIDLVEDGGGTPTGAVIQSWTFPQSGFSGTGNGTALRRCTLDVPLGCGRTLWVVARRSAGVVDATNYFIIGSGTTEYPWAGFFAAQQRGGVWTQVIANHYVALYTVQGFRQPKVASGWICTGEAIATGTKTFSGLVMTNGVTGSTTAVSGNIGNDAGAVASYPGNGWAWASTGLAYRSSSGSTGAFGGPKMQISIASSTRVSLICFAGVYAELDELFSGQWMRFQKTADSTFWWGKQVTSDTTYEVSGGATPTVAAGSWAMYPEPQITAGQDFPSTLVAVDDNTIKSTAYTPA